MGFRWTNGFTTIAAREEPRDIVKRKIAREDSAIEYYSNLVTALTRALNLNITDWSRLGDFIPSPSQLEEAGLHWESEIDSVNATRMPFWVAEYNTALLSDNTYWVQFTSHALLNSV